ncbi:sigma-70 family RNA polymerase sigma factor [Feifania hominis]|uniref:RNA polymerase sigma factor SigS n=1 Tax=Feifania hominis TaxID=2763660 RepID=A0A926DD35_9FIRM|nr:sigma-70 family RNA polymerase sigma factor [Feifania hominis]MBC8535642.1 sigma-70 family RNA polymerase sigma factor [Feifania hominis]
MPQVERNIVYESEPDDALIRLAQSGDTQAAGQLLSRYAPLVKTASRKFYIIGAESDDVVQEGMIGLYKAITDYDFSRGFTFSAFAQVCIDRQILTAIRAAGRQKHIPLNSYISLFQQSDQSDRDLNLTGQAGFPSQEDPSEEVITREFLLHLREFVARELSHFEQEALQLYLEGQSYQQIADHFAKPVKSIYNAIWRIRRKVMAEFDESAVLQ